MIGWPARRRRPREATAPLDEDELVRRARGGDTTAFGELVRRHEGVIFRLAARMVGPGEAEDVAQGAFLRAWQGLGGFAGKAAFGTWLHRIAANLCLDHLRRAARFRPLPLDATALAVADARDVVEEAVLDVEGQSRRAVLAAALDDLPGEDRLLLALRVGEGLPYEVIGERLALNRARSGHASSAPARGCGGSSRNGQGSTRRCTMDCAEARLLASARLDRPLTPGEATNLDAHLARCSACRAFAQDLATNDRLLREGWAPAEVSASFADRVVAALPPRAAARPTPSSRRRALIAAALLLACLAGTVGADRVRAGVALVLRQVALRESPPPTAPALTVPLTRVTLGEARQLVPWPIRQPDPPPDGYRLLWVDAGAVYAFADGPAILLTYGPVTGEPRLAITQFRARAGEEIVGPVAPGAAREVPVGAGRGLAIEGRWVVRDGRQVWERGTLVRLIVERGDIVIQLEADPRAGWDADRLAALAEDLR